MRASLKNRSTKPCSRRADWFKTFMAATRPSLACTPRYTSPMPPSPRKSIRRYSPTIELRRRELLTMACSSEVPRGARVAPPQNRGAARALRFVRTWPLLAARGRHQLTAVLDGHGEGEHDVARARAGEEDADDVPVVVEDRAAGVARPRGADRQLVVVAQLREGVGLVERVLVAAKESAHVADAESRVGHLVLVDF